MISWYQFPEQFLIPLKIIDDFAEKQISVTLYHTLNSLEE
jgi:hypothetical protein